MVAAAARTGQLGTALDELLQHQRTVRVMFWRIWGSLAYPVAVGILNLLVIGFFMVYVVPEFKQMFLEFELQLPTATIAVIRLSDAIVWLVSGVGRGTLLLIVTLVVLLAYFAATGRGGVVLQRLVIESIPIVGVLWQWSGAASFLYLLSSLLDKNVQLTEALQLTADGTAKSDLRQAGRMLSAEVAKGSRLSDLVAASGCLPLSAVPLLRWGERTNSLPEATRILSAMFADRVRMRSDWLRSVAPPFFYVLVGLSAACVVIALYSPMIILIQGLV
jgi:type II secretory pathway component PulF